METLTHWKKLTHPDYLGAYALEPGQDMVLTIKSCAIEIVNGTDGKKQECMVIHFMENGVKPMICNKTNAKTITKIHKTPYIEQWSGKQIQLYASNVSAFGTQTEALRIRDMIPQQAQVDVTSAVIKLEGCTSLSELKTTFLALTKQEQSNKEVKALVESLKSNLK